MRLCVNQNGERIDDRAINVLHVMANESFAELASNLQREIEEETGVKFGTVQLGALIGLTYEETATLEKEVAPEQAQIVQRVAAMSPEPEKAELPSGLEPAREVIVAAAIANKAVVGIKYTETVTQEKTISHDEATNAIGNLEKSKTPPKISWAGIALRFTRTPSFILEFVLILRRSFLSFRQGL